ncbi:HAMP domain-containing sensor histidine kinase [Agrococcus sp. ARC_14]|uniref:sensor histidine kinase n=1 Tax=Agrococcus sp. ARC_14 TaxID=2919927 RepID=UPI001F058FB4|nr:HAMP domain-containing sensor histidine kinase [Agrococcus sp. ARC_14]MCH1884037.1 HAMP domain-containing histidine kinase [Agrococcus sp. ARC_14]
MPDAARPRLRTWTVRSRIVGLLTLLSLVTVFAAGTVAYFSERARVLEQIDVNLRAALESGSFTVAQEQWPSLERALAAVVQRLAPDDNTGTLGILDGRAALVPGVETDLQLEHLPGLVERVITETADHGTVMGTYVNGEGRSVRYLAAPVAIGEVDESQPPQAIFVTGYDIDGELAEINEAARVFTITAFIAVTATFLIGLWVSGRLLRPIRRMREVAERSSAATLDERIPVGDGRDDVSQLAVTVNRMLDRLGGALDSQRELLRDVGHELKTPITIVRGHLELVDTGDPADVVATRDLAIDELDRMAMLVDDLRAAARLRDPGAFSIRPTDLAVLTEQIAAKASAIAGAVIDETVPSSPVSATLDPDRITQAMLQLVANAVRHAEGPITIGSRARGRDIELFVRDRGPGVPDELKAEIFERFHRGQAEGRGDGGSGLGLSIVELIAETHGGRAWVADSWSKREGEQEPRRGSEFILALPGAVVVEGAAHEPATRVRETDHAGIAPHPPVTNPTGAAWQDARTTTEEQHGIDPDRRG